MRTVASLFVALYKFSYGNAIYVNLRACYMDARTKLYRYLCGKGRGPKYNQFFLVPLRREPK